MEAQTVTKIVNAASYKNQLAPGALASIFGTSLAQSINTAALLPLPSQLGGVSVTVGGIAAPLLYVSPTQINLLIPFEVGDIPSGSEVTQPVVISSPTGMVSAFVSLQREAPAIFTTDGSGLGNAVAFDSNFQKLNAVGNTPIIIYATGLGPVETPVSAASGASLTGPADSIMDPIRVEIGGNDAQVQFAGLAPGLPGVYQLNVVPNSPATNALFIIVNGTASNGVTLPVQAGLNISQVFGSITNLYPASISGQPEFGPITISQLLLAANLSVDFVVNGSSEPFSVIATASFFPAAGPPATATAEVAMVPSGGKWTATLTLPTSPARVFDFGTAAVYDLLTCQTVEDVFTCLQFPGNIVPISRVDSSALLLLGGSSIPAPAGSVAVPETGNVIYAETGSIPLDGHFVISSSQLSELATFAGFEQLGQIPAMQGSVVFELTADGLLLDYKTVSVQTQ